MVRKREVRRTTCIPNLRDPGGRGGGGTVTRHRESVRDGCNGGEGRPGVTTPDSSEPGPGLLSHRPLRSFSRQTSRSTWTGAPDFTRRTEFRVPSSSRVVSDRRRRRRTGTVAPTFEEGYLFVSFQCDWRTKET